MQRMNEEPKVAVVALNWNKRDDICRLIDSIETVNYDNMDIFVVDNGSTDDSVACIKERYPALTLLCNEFNLGGTGGFNSGVKYVLGQGGYDYIWLLDNDATVSSGTLTPLVATMEGDRTIGIAGSKILNAEDHGMIVEVGANFNWLAGKVVPVCRNMPDRGGDSVYDVDYVAICSALLRVSAIENIGLMDERYFLLWDDMDWGVTFKSHGFRVVSVESSIVFHAAFTEKRTPLIDWYYGVRNPLLTFSKHGALWQRTLSLYNILRRAAKSFCLCNLSGLFISGRFPALAVRDYLRGCWGKIQSSNVQEKNRPKVESDFAGKSLLVLPSGSFEEVSCLLKLLKSLDGKPKKIALLVQDDRPHLFRQLEIDEIHTYHAQKDLYSPQNLMIFMRLAILNYNVALHPAPQRVCPFSYIYRQVYAFDNVDGFQKTGDSVFQIWKVLVASIGGEILALLVFPLVLMKSISYKRQASRQ